MAFDYCAIIGCENRATPGSDVNFYKIPRNKAGALWLSYCKDGTFITKGRVCSNHFSKDDYKSTDETHQYLKDDAIPAIDVKSQKVTLFISTTKDKKDLNPRVGKAAEISIEIIKKQEMERILYETRFCSVCLENDGYLHDLETKVDIIYMHEDIGGSLCDLAHKVFGEMISKTLPSSYLCKNCTDTVINNYIFIQKAKQTAETLESYIDHLLFQVDDTSHKVDEANNMDHVILTLFEKCDNQKTQYHFEITQDHFEDTQDHYEDTQDLFEDTQDHFEDTQDHFEDTQDFGDQEKFESNYASSDSETCYKISKARKSKLKSRFKCPDCTTQKCIHEKYLQWFKRQKLAGNKEVRCRDCNDICKTRSTYIEHVNSKHLRVPTFMCDQCNKVFPSKVFFRRHMRKFHTKLFECKNCDAKFKDETICDEHMSTCLIKKEPLPSSKLTAIPDSYKQFDGNKNKESQTYSCNMCFFKTKSITGFKNHKNKTHGLLQIVYTTHTDCTICHKEYKSRQELIFHMKSHPSGSMHTCKFCNKEFGTQRKCRLHIKTVHLANTADEKLFVDKKLKNKFHTNSTAEDSVTPFLCQLCGRNYRSKGALSVHMKDHKGLVACPVCSKKMLPSSLSSHMWRHQGYENDPNFQAKLDKKKKPNHACELCNYFTSSLSHIESHINRYHLKIQPYICKICKKSFSGRHLLRIHQDVHNTKIARFSCDLCEKDFKQRLGLIMHMRSAHTGEKPFCCDVCGDSFISTTLLCKHKRRKHEPAPVQRMNCPLCKISLFNVVSVRRHIKRIHWKGEGKFNMVDVPGLTKEDRDRLDHLRRSSLVDYKGRSNKLSK